MQMKEHIFEKQKNRNTRIAIGSVVYKQIIVGIINKNNNNKTKHTKTKKEQTHTRTVIYRNRNEMGNDDNLITKKKKKI